MAAGAARRGRRNCAIGRDGLNAPFLRRRRHAAKDDAFANLGYEILAQGPRGPLIVERTDGDALLIALLFHTDRSTLPYRVGFPIFVSNVVQAALKQSGLAEAEATRTGVLPALTLAPNRAVHITGPDRFDRDDHTDDRGQLTGIPGPPRRRPHHHRRPAPHRRQPPVPAETSLAAGSQIEFADQLTVAASTAVPMRSATRFQVRTGTRCFAIAEALQISQMYWRMCPNYLDA